VSVFSSVVMAVCGAGRPPLSFIGNGDILLSIFNNYW